MPLLHVQLEAHVEMGLKSRILANNWLNQTKGSTRQLKKQVNLKYCISC